MQKVESEGMSWRAKNMKKIYSKMVRERREPFQIETSIQIDERGKYVAKKNLTSAGIAHIKRMEETYQKSDYSEILCPCFLEKGVVYFQYVEGVSFGEKLLEAIEAADFENIKKLVKEYDDILRYMCQGKNKEQVNDSCGFYEIFGKCGENEEYGYRDLVFDLTFDNIIFRGNKPYIIDYEWRFSFPVSIEFIKFRAVYAFEMKYHHQIVKLYSDEEFYQLFDVGMEKTKKYLAYNNSFISYVYGEYGYQNIVQKYRKKIHDIFFFDKVAQFEKIIYSDILSLLNQHQDLFDDYTKFFRVTEKIKKSGTEHYVISEEFCKELHLLLKNNLEMTEFYKKQLEEKERIEKEELERREQKEQEREELERREREEQKREEQRRKEEEEKKLKNRIKKLCRTLKQRR